MSAGRSPESNNLITSVRAPAPELDHELRPVAEALPDLTLDDATLRTLRDMLADMVLPAEASGLDSDVPYAAAPARADDLRGLPPTFICVGGADGFRDENIEYALRLGQAGVPTELHVYPGAPHGFELFGDIGIAQQANHDIEQWVERQLRQVA